MSEVGRPLPKMSQYSGLDRLHSFRLLGVVGDAVLRAVGVRHKQRPFAVVAAAGAHRLALFLPRCAVASLAPFSGVLFSLVLRSGVGYSRGELSRVVHALLRSRAFWGLTEHLLNWQCAVHCDTTTAKLRFSHV